MKKKCEWVGERRSVVFNVLGEMKKMLNANVFSTVPLGEDDCCI
jgi:hypothetical protein